MKWGIFLIVFLLLVPAVPIRAAGCQFDVSPSSISLNPPEPIIDVPERIYFTINHNCPFDVEGSVQFFVDGTPITFKAFSVKQNGKPDEMWTSWTPHGAGDHTFSVRIASEGAPADLEKPPEIKLPLFIDLDTDHDLVGNRIDLDDDNDQVLDTQDQFPLDPTRSKDTDGDGIEDTVDSDDDNDGLYDVEEVKLGTDPLKRDTDGDGVGDKEDAYPLDPKRSKVPPPPAPAPAPRPTPPPAISHVSKSQIVSKIVSNQTKVIEIPAEIIPVPVVDQPVFETITIPEPTIVQKEKVSMSESPASSSSSWISAILKTFMENRWLLGVIVVGLGAAGGFFWLSKRE
ncbi:hypothetical protein EXS71_01185 [Candidatus Uhrbacteria bacterium]|nr:hypothetical protein [Candidatus Uhrbacteria bacterium]